MKKLTLIAIVVSFMALSVPHDAHAFLLPPFKTDFTNTIQKWYTTVKTKVVQTKKKIEESTFIQTVIQYGKGAKEVWDYKNTLTSYKDIDPKKLGSLASQFKKTDKKKTEARDKAAQDAANATREGNEKISDVNKNINELSQDSLEHPEKAKENMKKISKLQKQKEQITEETYETVKGINESRDNILSGLNAAQEQLMAELKPLTQIISLAKNYNSAEDLKDTLTLISPKEGTELSANIIFAYREVYYALYWADMSTVLSRNTIIRSGLIDDNKAASDVKEKNAEVEGSTAAQALASVELKKSNMLAVINYTELVLQRLKLNISHDLAFSGFNQINEKTSISDFNFDNYKFNPEKDQYSVSSTPAVQHKDGEAIPEDISGPSEEAVAASFAAISAHAQKERESAAAAEAAAEAGTAGEKEKSSDTGAAATENASAQAEQSATEKPAETQTSDKGENK